MQEERDLLAEVVLASRIEEHVLSRAGAGYGEVRWDTAITNHNGEAVANYDVLTMVSEKPVPDA